MPATLVVLVVKGMRAIAPCLALSIAAACAGWQEQGSHVAAPGAASNAAPTQLAVPADWQRVSAYELLIPLPREWKKTLDTVGKSDRPDPDPPQILVFREQGADPAAARELSMWIWSAHSVDDLVRTRFVEGNLSFVSQTPLPASREMREVVGRAQWSGPAGSGTYLARHLFVQVDAARVLDVITFGARVASTETAPSAELRRIQEIVAHNVQSPPATGCPRTRTVDAYGVITSDGRTGIVDRTYASAVEVNDAFTMVQRPGAVGQRVAVEFRQIGASAPATWVAYSVVADARPTPPGIRATPWDGAAFKLGVKPIGFANSCWRLIVDGVNTGLALQIGP